MFDAPDYGFVENYIKTTISILMNVWHTAATL